MGTRAGLQALCLSLRTELETSLSAAEWGIVQGGVVIFCDCCQKLSKLLLVLDGRGGGLRQLPDGGAPAAAAAAAATPGGVAKQLERMVRDGTIAEVLATVPELTLASEVAAASERAGRDAELAASASLLAAAEECAVLKQANADQVKPIEALLLASAHPSVPSPFPLSETVL